MKAAFIPPTLLLRADAMLRDPRWEYQLKRGGYRAIASKTGGYKLMRTGQLKVRVNRGQEVVISG